MRSFGCIDELNIVGLKATISGHDLEILDLCLGYQHAIKWVFVMARKAGRHERVLNGDRQRAEIVPFNLPWE
jgi:hypothetical protein